MNQLKSFLQNNNKIVFLVFALVSIFVSPAVALLFGLIYALTIGNPFPTESKKISKSLLQYSVVGLGFGMNLQESLQTGKEGMVFTIISVFSVMIFGYLLGKKMNIDPKSSYLISSGTAICGGSAIAATAPVIKANDHEISVAMGTIFILNAVALFIFPPIGRFLEMTQQQFGLWAAIAIHDTSSVVGAGAAYGEEALKIATTVKLTRALWIIPLAFVSNFLFKQKDTKVNIPWFILFFVVAIILNSYLPIPAVISESITWLSRKGLTVTLFLIGAGLSRKIIKQVGIKPMLQGVILWIFISLISLWVILY